MTTGNREDYLISILRLTGGETAAKTTELATFMGVSPASVSEMLKILAKEGEVEYIKYKGVKLTASGLTEARQIRKRHHVVEKFLTDVLDIDHQTAHEEAHRIEHTISDESAVKMCSILGHPPDCDCQSCIAPCKAVVSSGVDVTSRLMDMHPGESGKISYLRADDGGIVKKLLSMGFVPGRDIAVDSKLSESGPRVVKLGSASVVLDAAMASAVFVDVVGN
ncbi:MAG: metal-dependent transcriptional regulator [Candidatus Methanomethylophilus sp.]|nr:metal-dependent transcriptional regulator [Methanomethylophilus sp.]MDD4669039.1 metal-dependent transcriptional regulator [Methanomethylophilus sp.]